MWGQCVQRLAQGSAARVPLRELLSASAHLGRAHTTELTTAWARVWQQAAGPAESAAWSIKRWQAATGRGFASLAVQAASRPAACQSGVVHSTGVIATRQLCSTTAAAAGSSSAQPCHRGIAEGLSGSAAKQLAVWLGITSGWVASMVVLGGVTRLTRSGLSMTDWKFTGEKPPRTQEDWDAEFAKYRQSPEFQRVNRSMGLDDFKFIYWMEYTHRMWGRVLGLVFALPAAYFVARGAVPRPLGARLGLLLLMGGTQGAVGWWMVKSGLETPEQHHETPRVSPYRLAAHLASAFSIYAVLLWTMLSLAAPEPLLAGAAPAVRSAAAHLRRAAIPLAALIALTAASGAFVAGLDAGHAYNTFPLMGSRLVPEEYWALPGWRNAFENTAAVQFHHRVLALTTLGSVAALWTAQRRAALPPATRTWLNALLAATAAQVSLGVTTLLTFVPVSLGAAHQTGALTLLTVALGLLHSLRRPMATPSVAARAFTPVTAAATLGVWAMVLRAPEAALQAQQDHQQQQTKAAQDVAIQ